MTKQPEPGRFFSGVLAVIVHVAFIALLLFGISWQQRTPLPVVADLWQDIPTPRKTAIQPEPEPPPPPPPPKAEPPPEPVKPVQPKAAPEPKPAVPTQPSRAEIELKEKQRKLEQKKAEEQARREETQRKAEEVRRKKEEARKEAEARKQEELQRQVELKREQEARKREQERQLEELRREDERRLEREAEARRAAIVEEQQKLALAAKQRAEEEARKRAEAEAAAAKQKLLNQYIDRIKLKVRGRVVIPPGMSGNPKAVYSVTLLPGGEVLDIKLVRSSGVPAYDAAVERAIRAAEPLPVPSEPELFQQLREAKYEFRPNE
jgi:colicin import membrane protein